MRLTILFLLIESYICLLQGLQALPDIRSSLASIIPQDQTEVLRSDVTGTRRADLVKTVLSSLKVMYLFFLTNDLIAQIVHRSHLGWNICKTL